MTDFDGENDDFENIDEDDVRDQLTRKMRTEGALIAYRTAISICLDPKATAAAKASAVNSLFRAGGFFVTQDAGADAKDFSDMSPVELDRAIRKAKADLKQRQDASEKPGEKPRRKPRGGLFD